MVLLSCAAAFTSRSSRRLSLHPPLSPLFLFLVLCVRAGGRIPLSLPFFRHTLFCLHTYITYCPPQTGASLLSYRTWSFLASRRRLPLVSSVSFVVLIQHRPAAQLSLAGVSSCLPYPLPCNTPPVAPPSRPPSRPSPHHRTVAFARRRNSSCRRSSSLLLLLLLLPRTAGRFAARVWRCASPAAPCAVSAGYPNPPISGTGILF